MTLRSAASQRVVVGDGALGSRPVGGMIGAVFLRFFRRRPGGVQRPEGGGEGAEQETEHGLGRVRREACAEVAADQASEAAGQAEPPAGRDGPGDWRPYLSSTPQPWCLSAAAGVREGWEQSGTLNPPGAAFAPNPSPGTEVGDPLTPPGPP